MNMKVIIIAAGMGQRMAPLTDDLPKCLAIRFNGKALLETQIETFRSVGLSDIVVICGYQGDKIQVSGIRKVWNNEFASNNIMESLFKAKEELEGPVLVTYSDIWFEKTIPQSLIENSADILLAVGTDWESQYEGRVNHPITEAEVVILNEKKNVRKIGKIFTEGEPCAEFIGMLKLSPEGCRKIRSSYEEAKKKFDKRPFERAKIFEKAYLTDLLQFMSNKGIDISCLAFQGQWCEMDTLEDRDRWIRSMNIKK